MKRIITPIFLLFTFLYTATAQTPLTTAVDFTVTDVHGEEHNLFQMLDEGKHVVVDFFFTTCPPCIASVPTMNESFEKYGCNKGDIVYIAIDQGDSDAQVLAYETQYGGLFPAASGTEGGGNAVNSAYGISAYPTIILIAPDRKILSQDIYPVNHGNLDGAINGTAGITENTDACNLPTNTIDLSDSKLNSLRLFPNPAVQSKSTLEFELAEKSQMSIGIYNITGQEIQTIFKGEQLAGQHLLPLNVEALSQGAYFVRIDIDGKESLSLKLIK